MRVCNIFAIIKDGKLVLLLGLSIRCGRQLRRLAQTAVEPHIMLRIAYEGQDDLCQ